MKTIFKLLMMTGSLLSCSLIYIELTYEQRFDVPETGIRSSTDSAAIARGKYLVTGPGHCWTCHTPDAREQLQKGFSGDLSGGLELKLPFGTLYTPNITSDTATGIGKYTDEQLAQALRYSVDHQKKVLVPFMSYNSMTDEDLTAMISYLRSTPPIRHEVPEHNLNLLGKIVSRFLLKPVLPSPAPAKSVVRDTSAAYGQYLAYSVTNCHGCHTQRNSMGAFVGEPFAGGHVMETEHSTYTTPNLTPDPETGRIYSWSSETFVIRFQSGHANPDSPMPWKSYATMTEADLKALYNFLNSLEPVSKKVDVYQSKIPAGELQ
jgi:mono/diheme cytochrome c family protein